MAYSKERHDTQSQSGCSARPALSRLARAPAPPRTSRSGGSGPPCQSRRPACLVPGARSGCSGLRPGRRGRCPSCTGGASPADAAAADAARIAWGRRPGPRIPTRARFWMTCMVCFLCLAAAAASTWQVPGASD